MSSSILMSIAFEGKIDGEYRHIKALFAPQCGLRYAAERRTATALCPFHGLRLTLRWTLRFSCMGASAATP
ncbi:TPA: hypothetical protein ACH2LV_003382 [Vibrio cholerae]